MNSKIYNMIKRFYQKYINYIVVLLFACLMLKNCQSCNRKNELEWNKTTYNAKIDSLNNEINDLLIQNDRLKDTINILQLKCGAIDRENNILRDNNKKYQENTKNLIKKINNK